MKFPTLTLLSCTTIFLFFQMFSGNEAVYLNPEKILQGEYWRLFSGHLIHADKSHLLWNLAALAILGSLLEQWGKRLFLLTLLMGIVAVDLALLSSWTTLDYYCGFSGVLNSFLVVVLWMEWKKTPHLLILAVGIFSLLKIVVEMTMAQSLFTQISWPPYPPAHLCGYIAGLLLILGLHFFKPLELKSLK